MQRTLLKKIQFAAFLYDVSPEARKASEKCGIRKLVMLVSERLAQAHSVDSFKMYERSDMCEFIAEALLSQEEFPPESLEFCELVSIVSQLEKGSRGAKDLSKGELQQTTIERSRTIEQEEESLEEEEEEEPSSEEGQWGEEEEEEDEECLEGEEEDEECQEGSLGSTGTSEKPGKRHNTGLKGSKSFQTSPQMTDFDMDDTPGGLHQLLSIDEFRTYGRHDKIRFILKALVELGPREFPRGMTTVSQLLFIVNHLDRDSGGEWQGRCLHETRSFQPSPQRAHFDMNNKGFLKSWVHAQLHARQMLLPTMTQRNRMSFAPFPGVTYTAGWHKQVKSSNLAGNGQTFRENLFDIWMQAPEDEPSTSWRPASESFDKINRVMRNAYDGMYQRKIRPFLAPRAEGQGLRPAFDADKENAAPSIVAGKNSTGIVADENCGGIEATRVLKRQRSEPGADLQHRIARLLQVLE